MGIATRNGAVILKDGRAAESCSCCPVLGCAALSGFGGFISNWNYSSQFGLHTGVTGTLASIFQQPTDLLFLENLAAPTILRPGNGPAAFLNDVRIWESYTPEYTLKCRSTGVAVEVQLRLRYNVRAYPDNYFGVTVPVPFGYNTGAVVFTYRKAEGVEFFRAKAPFSRLTFEPSDLVEFSVEEQSSKPLFAAAMSRREISPYIPTSQDAGSVTIQFFSEPPSFRGEYEILHDVPSKSVYFNNVPIQFVVDHNSPTASRSFVIQGNTVNVDTDSYSLATYASPGGVFGNIFPPAIRYKISRWAFATLQANNSLTMTFPDLSYQYSLLPGGVDRGPQFDPFTDPQDLKRVLAWQGYFEQLPFFRGATAGAQSTLRKI